MSLFYIMHLANYSDGVLYLLMLLLLIELTVIFDRSWYLHKAIHKGKETLLTIACISTVRSWCPSVCHRAAVRLLRCG